MISGAVVLALAAAAAAAPPEQLWALNCQGCHRPDGSGSSGGAPPLRGAAGRLARTPAGRAYLVRVPGVAAAPLSDAEVAAVLNWMLFRFDRSALPRDFRPFEAAEVEKFRRTPLGSAARTERVRLLGRVAAENGDRQR